MVAYSALPFKRARCAPRGTALDLKPAPASRHLLPLQVLEMPRFFAVMATAVGLALLLLFMVPARGMAQARPIDAEGLRGGRHVASAAPLSAAPRLVAGAGYAFTEGVLDGSDRHQRAFGEIAVGYAPRQYLQIALGFHARYDGHRSDVLGSDSGAAFSTVLTTRHALSLSETQSLGAQMRLRFPAAQSVGRGLRAVSPELALLGTQLLAQRYELSAQLGYRFDRSLVSVSDPDALSAADRLAASLSAHDAVLLGLLFALPVGPLTCSAEWSWDIATGSTAPAPLQAPMRVRLAAQTTFASRYTPGFELGVSPSARPDPTLEARIEPRFWAAATFAVAFERMAPPPPAPVASAARVLPPPEPLRIALRITDATGDGVAGADVALEDEQSGTQRATTDADGVALLVLAPERTQRLSVRAQGFEPHEAEVSSESPREAWTVKLARSLPEGEIKGKVRSLRGGRALRARIVVQPLGTAVETDEDGNFVLAVPPGRYQLEISADGHESQERPAQVERLGVTILVVDLRRVTK